MKFKNNNNIFIFINNLIAFKANIEIRNISLKYIYG